MRLLKVLWMSMTFVALAFVAAAQADHGLRRDFYRLDRIEQDFHRYEADYQRAPRGSYAEEQANRARYAAHEDALREAEEVLVRRASGQHEESLARAQQYESGYQRAARSSLPEDLYSRLTDIAARGLVDDIRIAVRYMDSRQRYDLEAYFDRLYQQAPARSKIERVYLDARTAVRDGGSGPVDPYPTPYPTPIDPNPRPVNARLFAVTSDGARKELRSGQELVLVKYQTARLQGIIEYSNGNNESVPVALNVVSSAEAVRAQNGGSSIEAVRASINAAPAALSVRLDSRRIDFTVRVVLSAPPAFSQALAERAVQHAYRGIFDRDMDDFARSTYVPLVLREGWRGWQRLIEILVTSPEFNDKLVGKRPAEIVNRLFNGLLERDPGSEGHAAYDGRIQAGQHVAVVLAIGTSEEFRERILGH